MLHRRLLSLFIIFAFFAKSRLFEFSSLRDHVETNKNETDENSTTSNKCDFVEEDDEKITKVLTHLLQNYDKNLAPSRLGVDVQIELIVQAISQISEITSSFKADVLFSQIWHDNGLRFDKFTECITNLTLSYRMIEALWLPNVCFVNSKKAEVHKSPTPNIFLAIFPNGTVWTNYRVQVEAPCEMDLSTFPMDKVVCRVVFESYSFNVGKVRLRWKKEEPVIIMNAKNMKLPDFHLSSNI